MPNFMVRCSTTRSYWIVVEAPDAPTALDWYEGCDGGEFHCGEEEGWQLDECYEVGVEEVGKIAADYKFIDGHLEEGEQPNWSKVKSETI